MAAPGLRWLALAALLPVAGAAAGPEAGPGPAYLVYAGPYSSSPSSAFGHLFLALAARPDTPAPLWTVVTFNAVTFDADPFRYLTVGIAGGFLGRFDSFAFHRKTRDYELLEDRDLWLLELRLAPAQRAALEALLARDAGRWFPYTFFGLNCAHYLQALLAEATGAIPPPGRIVSPTGAFTLVAGSPLAGASYHRPSATRRIERLAGQARPEVRRRLQEDAWIGLAADGAWLDALSPVEAELAQEVFELRALRTETLLPAAATRGRARLRLARLEAPPDSVPEVASGPGVAVSPPAFHGYPRVRLLHEPGPAAGRAVLGLRGAMHDGADPWVGHQPASGMDLLSLEVSVPLDRPRPRLESAVLFSQRSLRPSDWSGPRASWLLEALARRGGVFGPSPIHCDARAGLGLTWQLPAGASLHGLVTLAVTGAFDHGVAPAPGLEAGLLWLLAERWRLGATWTGERDLLDWSRSGHRARVWTRLDLHARWGLVARADLAPWRSFALGVDFYP